MSRAVFMDRDGVLNRAIVDSMGVPHPPASVAELALEDGAAEVCVRLHAEGWRVIVVTNQPDVSRGLATRADVEAINDRLKELLAIDDILVCYHDDADGCTCRKPAPGLLIDGASRWEVDLGSSYMVGDRSSDVEAGRRAGCRTVLLERPYSGSSDAHSVVGTLQEASDLILRVTNDEDGGL